MKRSLSLILVTFAAHELLLRDNAEAQRANQLRDHPVAGVATLLLDGTDWLASNPIQSPQAINATVPGDVITDLEHAGLIPDPYFNVSWRDPVNVFRWANGTWAFSKTFDYDGGGAGDSALLVFDGIKMGARITLNDVPLGIATDQFLRYTYDVGHLLKSTGNVLSLRFEQSIDTGGRFMTCTGGYDWAPWSTTWKISPSVQATIPSGWFGGGAQATFSFGIWKSVYITTVRTVAITTVGVETFYKGEYPVEPMTDDNHGGFELHLTLDLSTPAGVPAGATVNASAPFGSVVQTTQALPAGNSKWRIVLPAPRVRLWWPAGMGEQAMYNVTIAVSTAGGTPAVATRQVGFRSIALVTINDTDAALRKSSGDHNGSGGSTMFLRINGAALFSRGGNKVPMEELEGRLSGSAHRRLVRSAAEAGFNMLRVWGGGIYEPDAFYDACDEFGVLVYHDLQFAVSNVALREIVHELYNYSAMYQNFSEITQAETAYQVTRLSHHPAIAIWDGCNECGGHGLGEPDDAHWEKHVMPIQVVVTVDRSRPVMPSCPSAGWSSGVNRLTGLPNGSPLIVADGSANRTTYPYPQESHGPYVGLGGNGWPSLNHWRSINTAQLELPQAYTLPASFAGSLVTGCQWTGWFKSMSAQLPGPEQWSVHSPAMYYRNWPTDLVMDAFFEKQDWNETGELAFKKQLYFSQLGQALVQLTLKNEVSAVFTFIERSRYNEIWSTGGWGSIEYGGNTSGQISGGRWKPFQYLLKASAYQDTFAYCALNGVCVLKHDGIRPFAGTALVTVTNLMSGAKHVVSSSPLRLLAGPAVTSWFCAFANASLTALRDVQPAHALANDSYTQIQGLIPSDRTNYTQTAQGPLHACEMTCDKLQGCVGFTRSTGAAPSSSAECFMYKSVPSLNGAAPTASFYLKPGLPRPPTAPTPPGPPPPPVLPPAPPVADQPHCGTFASMLPALGCAPNGSDCVLTVQVTSSGGNIAGIGDQSVLSTNVNLFVPPKNLVSLPRASITATVGEGQTDGKVPITLYSSHVALYVTLTTLAAGRFSDNAFLLHGGSKTIDFIPWEDFDISVLRHTLRAESLSDYQM